MLDLETYFLTHRSQIEQWFHAQTQVLPVPFYSSVDVRDAGFKISAIDTNLFPAGFNNLPLEPIVQYGKRLAETLAVHYPGVKQVLLIPESHTRNMLYFEHLYALVRILEAAGLTVRIGCLSPMLTQPIHKELPSGHTLYLEPLVRNGSALGVADYSPDYILLNHDLSSGVPSELVGLTQTLIPPIAMGWHQRSKSTHFTHYNALAQGLGEHLGIDPWLISAKHTRCEAIDFMAKTGLEALQETAAGLLAEVTACYRAHGVSHRPFLVLKANQGTYGMAVMMIQDPAELATINRKKRTHMATLKGGSRVSDVLIQEGVPSAIALNTHQTTAEPVLCLAGDTVLNGFYRLHKNKGSYENLNSPGMSFQPMAAEEPSYHHQVAARLAALAAGQEINDLSQED